jgi:hypothetical protein
MFFSGGQKRTENTSTAADEDAADNRTQFRERPMKRNPGYWIRFCFMCKRFE